MYYQLVRCCSCRKQSNPKGHKKINGMLYCSPCFSRKKKHDREIKIPGAVQVSVAPSGVVVVNPKRLDA